MKKFVSIILCLVFCLGMVTTNVFATNKQSVEDGLYTLKNVSSGYMLNVYAGKDANGTKVTTWKFDGTTDQQIYIQHQGNGKYLLQFKASSVGRVIDVNRGESLTAPLDNGDGIDIWTANDLDAQYFYINSCDDGSYTFELIAKPNHVISAVSSSAAASNGTQLQLKQFKDADYQKWYLCDLNGCIVQSKEDNGTQKCSHNITSKQLLSVERKAASEREYHNVVEIYSVKCEDCGISLDNEKVFIQESHIDGFDEDNICTYCNEPIICAHQFTKEATNEEITPLNADQHMVNLEKYEYCSGCGDKLLIFESYTSGEPHNFKGNTCSDCGYEKCSHSKTYKVKKSSEVKQYDDQHHIITEIYDMICSDCGTTVEQNKSADNKETHSGSTCASCGYSKPFQNKSAWVITTGGSRLILRTQPSISSAEIYRIPQGSEVTAVGEPENGYTPIKYGSYRGYVSTQYISFTKPTSSSTSFIWPVKGSGRVTCIYQGYKGHNGVDIGGNPAGTSMEIVASKAGTVSYVTTACSHDFAKSYNCGCAGGFGRYIKINHGDGTETIYAHLRSINVSVGQYVNQGQKIAMMGTTGWSSGVHLHFEVRVNGTPQNPQNYIKY